MLVIKKTVDLSVLGESYSGIELTFKSLPARVLPDLDKKRSAFRKNDKGDPLLADALPFFANVCKENFISGKQGEAELSKEDIDELDENSLIYCFQVITGQIADPKVSSESTNTSTTSPSEAEK